MTSARTELRKRLGCILRPNSPSPGRFLRVGSLPTPEAMVAQSARCRANSSLRGASEAIMPKKHGVLALWRPARICAPECPRRWKALSLLVKDRGSRLMLSRIEQRLHLEAAGRGSDERDHELAVHQRLAAAADADEGKAGPHAKPTRARFERVRSLRCTMPVGDNRREAHVAKFVAEHAPRVSREPRAQT